MVSLRNAKVGATVLAALAWVGAITLLIAHQPDPGAATPRELRDELAVALNARDSGALSDLLDYPAKGASAFADSYLATLTSQDVHAIAVRLSPDDRTPTSAIISGVAANGDTFSYTLAVTSDNGRWTAAFTPPLP